MQGAGALGAGVDCTDIPQAGPAAAASEFQAFANYVALPASEAFRIEYWKLEEAKIRRQPPEKELSRRIMMIVGGGSGIGREVALLAAQRGAHIMVADRDIKGAENVCEEAKAIAGKEAVSFVKIDIRDRKTIRAALDATISQFGGLDILINTAAIFPASPDGVITDAMWGVTLEINVTANFMLTDEAEPVFAAQGIDASIVLTSSANAVVAKRGTEAYDVSKAALSHLVRELAITYSPKIRVNGISPATVVKGSTMFPRDRVIASLTKYNLVYDEKSSDDELRNELARFYARRTLTGQPIDPSDCAQAILFLAGPLTPCTTGHIFPVDGGLTEAFLR
jgi:NAD(P)-dependent dehydrogenase (short-subunit alcohol dehydrogenase family)